MTAKKSRLGIDPLGGPPPAPGPQATEPPPEAAPTQAVGRLLDHYQEPLAEAPAAPLPPLREEELPEVVASEEAGAPGPEPDVQHLSPGRPPETAGQAPGLVISPLASQPSPPKDADKERKAMKDKKMKVEGVMELSQAITYLENVLDSLKQGQLVLEAGQESLVLSPPSIVDFEMEVARKKDKEKFQVEISWKTGSKAKGTVEVVVSSK